MKSSNMRLELFLPAEADRLDNIPLSNFSQSASVYLLGFMPVHYACRDKK